MRRQVSGRRGRGGERLGSGRAAGHRVSLGGDGNGPTLGFVDGCETANMLPTVELYTLRCVSYISMKLF